MTEYTRIVTIQVTQIMQTVDMFADDVEKDTMSERFQKQEIKRIKKKFDADDVQMQVQLFRRDIEQ